VILIGIKSFKNISKSNDPINFKVLYPHL